ncbi:MAG TPA: NAD(P)-dependent oxidoreductase, partial [Bacilli bacterium]|nr:NAD(P)-dependent oxidoreductase [Bacilli bacterium]
MKIFIIGGTGLLGSQAAAELISRGHKVSSIALPPIPDGALLPKEMEISLGNYIDMSDEELLMNFEGCEGFIFAAGVDERIERPPSIYQFFKKYNIDTVKRLLGLAKKAGVKHAVILGSYFSYFAKKNPEMELTKWHPYIRSRIDQEKEAFKFADLDFDVAILELPYIFGTQPGRKPVWTFLVENLLMMKKLTFYPKGGTTMLTVKQVGQAIAGALEKNKGANAYPIGYYNMEWKEMIGIFNENIGLEKNKIVTVPKFLYRMMMKKIMKEQIENNIEGGLNMVKFTDIQCSNL